jgi:photosystem II stability/assembly factor-like uncharacterized protein
MRSLPEKFLEYSRRKDAKPALIASIQTSLFYVEQTNQVDWTAAWSYSNVDWTPTPPEAGDVQLLESDPNCYTEQTSQNGQTAFLYWHYHHYQSFKHTAGYRKRLKQISLWVLSLTPNGGQFINVTIADSGQTDFSSTVSMSTPITGWYTFDFLDDGVFIENNTLYNMHVRGYTNGFAQPALYMRTDSSAYPVGQLDRYIEGTGWTYNIGDLAFKIDYSYPFSGHLTTKVMSLSLVPEQNGEWMFDDVIPGGTSLVYQAWGVNTPSWTFPASWEDIGTVVDGQAIMNLKQFYRVRANFAANSAQDLTPTLSRVRADFSVYEKFADASGLGIPVALLDVDNLASEIDLFDDSTIGQISLKLARTRRVNQIMDNRSGIYLKNKIVKVMAGFVSDGFAEADFIDYRWGQVEDYSIENDDSVTVKLKDPQIEWDAKVPRSWASSIDNVTWNGSHHVDVIKDLLTNRIGFRESKLILDSFETVRSQTSGYQVHRTITGGTEKAKDLVNELRLDLGAYLIVDHIGRAGLKKWDAAASVVASLSDKDFLDLAWRANGEKVYNQVIGYYAWTDTGSEDYYAAVHSANDLVSQYNYQQVLAWELEDKWTTAANSRQIGALSSLILDRYSQHPPIIEGTLDRRWITLEPGDLVRVSTTRAPSPDGVSGDVAEKYQIVRTELDFTEDRIGVTLLAANVYEDWKAIQELSSGYQVSNFVQTDDGALLAGTTWAENSGGEIWRSNDQGSSWVNVHTMPSSHRNIYAIENLGGNVAIAAGISVTNSYGLFYRSSNAGSSWTFLDTYYSPLYFEALCSPYSGTAVAGSNTGFIRRSSDQGSSWTNIGFIVPAAVKKIVAVNSNAMLFLCTSGDTSMIYRSSDAGSSWTFVFSIGEASNKALSIISSGMLFATHHRIFSSLDQGSSWTFVTTLAPLSISALSMERYGGNIYIGGAQNALWKSTDQGNTWALDKIVTAVDCSQGAVNAITSQGSAFLIGKGGGSARIYRWRGKD